MLTYRPAFLWGSQRGGQVWLCHMQVCGLLLFYSPKDCSQDYKDFNLAQFPSLGWCKETWTSLSDWPDSPHFLPPQNIQPLLELDQNRSKLKLYIGHLTALCHDRDPLILRGLTPPASYNLDDDQAAWENELQKMTQEQVSLTWALTTPSQSSAAVWLMQ